MVTVLLGLPAAHGHHDPGDLPLDADESRAVQLLARSGLVSGQEAASARARSDVEGRRAVG